MRQYPDGRPMPPADYAPDEPVWRSASDPLPVKYAKSDLERNFSFWTFGVAFGLVCGSLLTWLMMK